MGFFGDIADGILNAVKATWNLIKNIVNTIITSFRDHIVRFFRERRNKIDANTLAISIKSKLNSGDCSFVNCLYDQENNEIINPENDAQIVNYEQLDQQTKNAFNGKDMLVLK